MNDEDLSALAVALKRQTDEQLEDFLSPEQYNSHRYLETFKSVLSEVVESFAHERYVSQHKFEDEWRSGFLTQGTWDRPAIALIRKHFGVVVADQQIDGLTTATGAKRVRAIFDYFELAALSVIVESGPIEFENIKEKVNDKPFLPQHLAIRLCVKHHQIINNLQHNKKWPNFEMLDEFLELSILYHKMMLSTIERDALYKMKESAKGRSKFTDTKRYIEQYGLNYIESRRSINLDATTRAAAQSAIKLFKSRHPDEKSPALRTVQNWIKQAREES